ncbi:MAG: RcnB family protein [Alphaproteobacteria bacterium]|nr:RcnB family protein [Alphaproteobacteria bacterium]
MPAYYSPYRNHRYTRFSIGFSLGSLFYSSRYWINDPWQYRLPPAYDGYRWVRYYNDAILVDTYSGQVVDVIHDFFW